LISKLEFGTTTNNISNMQIVHNSLCKTCISCSAMPNQVVATTKKSCSLTSNWKCFDHTRVDKFETCENSTYLNNNHNSFEPNYHGKWIISNLHEGCIVAFTNLKLKEIEWWKFDTRGNELGDFDKERMQPVSLKKQTIPSTKSGRKLLG